MAGRILCKLFFIQILVSVSSMDMLNILNLFVKENATNQIYNDTDNEISNREFNLCENQWNIFKKDLIGGSSQSPNWALQMLDASSKIPSGIFTGNTLDNGNYHECLAVNNAEQEIYGKYCAWTLFIPISMIMKQVVIDKSDGFVASLCIPNLCEPIHVAQILGIDERLIVSSDMCSTKETYSKLDGADWAFLSFLIVIFLVVIASTLYDIHLRNANKKPIHLITLAFSIYTNGQKILKISHNPDQLLCLNGLRVFSILWIIAGHRYALTKALPLINKYESDEWVKNPWSEYVQGAPVAVDTFLFLSGTLMAIGFIKTQSVPKAKFNIILFYIHRYLRLTPALAVLYFYHVSVMKHVTSGPMWHNFMERENYKCTTYWWTFFLYIQTLVNHDAICLLHTWYLSLDMQIYFISPLVLIPLVKYPKMAVYLLVALICLSVVPPIIICFAYELVTYTPEYERYYYYMPYNRLSPWLVGLLTGVILTNYKNTKIKISRLVNLCIWGIVLAMMCAILYLVNTAAYEYERYLTAFVTGLHRMFWALGLMWIVFACLKGYGGLINWFLSLPMFQVIARFTYSMYLLHIPLLMIALISKKTAMIWDDFEIINNSLGDIVIVSFLSLIWTLLFESPMIIVEKIIFAERRQTTDKTQASAPIINTPTSASAPTEEVVNIDDDTLK